MPLSQDDRAYLKQIYNRLVDGALEPGNSLYQPLYEGESDPVALMANHIDFMDSASIQTFSGFQGSGKTTELYRLRQRLFDGGGYVVLYSSAMEYLNPAEPVTIAELLPVIAGAFSDTLLDLGVDLNAESYWTRLWAYLTKTDVTLPEAGIEVDGTGVGLKLALRTTPTFRARVREILSRNIGELKREVNRFVEDGVKAVRAARGKDTRIVFIFDQLEQFRGSYSNEEEVFRSIEVLFSQHDKDLALPYVHTVYTVPPWLQIVRPNTLQNRVIPCVRQWNPDESRSSYDSGWRTLRGALYRRFENEPARFFGPPNADGNYRLADKLIAVCGGHFRDLLLLIRESVLRAQSLPVSDETIEAAIASIRGNFLPIAVDDARWLDEIGRLRQSALPTSSPADVNRLTRFLDTHFVLYLRNGDEWYDIHPLIRDEVSRIVARAAQVHVS